MAQRDQLEVVSPSGELLFFDLDERDGVTNIGRHPSNDVVLNGQGIADFHLVIDHRARPYQVSLISADAQATVGGATLEQNRTYALHDWDTILLAGFAVILVEGDGGGGAVPIAAAAATAAILPSPTIQPSYGAAPGAPPPVAQPAPELAPQAATVAAATIAAATVVAAAPVITPAGARPLDGQNGQAVHAPSQSLSDIIDETIILEISAREVTVNVEESASWQLTIANGGRLVARFEVHIEGWIDGSWVTIDPAFVNLFEGGRGFANVTITPPRMPTSRAGLHHLAIVVTSPNYPGLRAQRAVTLIINPYYEFHVGDVNPRKQTVGYFRRTAQLKLPVENRGNSELVFRLEGTDDENLITFEMDSPVEATRLVRQMEFPLAPSQSLTLNLSATPRTINLLA